MLLSKKPHKKFSKSKLIFYHYKLKKLLILKKDLMFLERKLKNLENHSWRFFHLITMETIPLNRLIKAIN